MGSTVERRVACVLAGLLGDVVPSRRQSASGIPSQSFNVRLVLGGTRHLLGHDRLDVSSLYSGRACPCTPEERSTVAVVVARTRAAWLEYSVRPQQPRSRICL